MGTLATWQLSEKGMMAPLRSLTCIPQSGKLLHPKAEGGQHTWAQGFLSTLTPIMAQQLE